MDKNLAHEVRAFGNLGSWYEGPWVQRETLNGSYEVVHQETGTVLATLPDFAAPIALWMCVAREALPALLADTDAHTVKVLREAARLMEFTGRNDDAVNFLDQLADRAERTE